MNKSIARDKHFNLSKSTKRVLATLVGQAKADHKNLMIAAEINEEISHRTPYNEDEFFGRGAKTKDQSKSNKQKGDKNVNSSN